MPAQTHTLGTGLASCAVIFFPPRLLPLIRKIIFVHYKDGESGFLPDGYNTNRCTKLYNSTVSLKLLELYIGNYVLDQVAYNVNVFLLMQFPPLLPKHITGNIFSTLQEVMHDSYSLHDFCP